MMRVFLILCGLLISEKGSAAVLYIVRHGQTDWNVERKIQGWTDIPLNDMGRAQAAELKEKLKGIDFTFCFSSDLQRARETALILTDSMDVQMDVRLRERNFGPWEGFHSSGYNALLHEKDVESDAMLQQRAFACLEDIAALHPQGHILIATHGGLMRNIISKLCSVATTEIHVENMALLRLQISEQGMAIEDMQGIELP
jgi:broad specificity phosphatase PhoE